MRNFTIGLIAGAVFLAGSAAVGFTVKTLRVGSERSLQERVNLIAGQTSLRLGEFLNTRLLAVKQLQFGLQQGVIDGRERFTTLSLAAQEDLTGFQALNWIDEDHILRWVVPEAGNEGAIGRSVLDSPLAKGAVLEAGRTGAG